jgi:hypothetical protein
VKPQLIIVGTSHEENGQTNVDDLYNIICEIEPESIFEEIPIDLYSRIYETNELPETIEVKAVRKYVNSHKIDHLPIDLNNLGSVSRNLGLKNIDEEISEYINQSSNSRIVELGRKLEYMDSKGHKQINSKRHFSLDRKKRKLTVKYLQMNNRELYLKNMVQNEFHFGIREYNMITEINKNIRKYNKSLLLIGYYHLESISLKLRNEYRNMNIIMYK